MSLGVFRADQCISSWRELLYIWGMDKFFFILLAVSLLAVLASLFTGLFAMARGKEADAGLSQKMMRLRVILQGLRWSASCWLYWLAADHGALNPYYHQDRR